MKYVDRMEKRLKRLSITVFFGIIACFIVLGEVTKGIPTVGDVLVGNDLFIYELWSLVLLILLGIESGMLGVLAFIVRLKNEESVQTEIQG